MIKQGYTTPGQVLVAALAAISLAFAIGVYFSFVSHCSYFSSPLLAV